MARLSRSSAEKGPTCCSPAGMGADALRVICEDTRGLPTSGTGGTITFDIFTFLAVIVAFAAGTACLVIAVFMVTLLRSEEPVRANQNTPVVVDPTQ